MASVKMTFSLDQETASRLEETARALHRSKSEVVRDAINDYAEAAHRLGNAERRRLLDALDELLPQIPERPLEEVDAELAAIRSARRLGRRGIPETS